MSAFKQKWLNLVSLQEKEKKDTLAKGYQVVSTDYSYRLKEPGVFLWGTPLNEVINTTTVDKGSYGDSESRNQQSQGKAKKRKTEYGDRGQAALDTHTKKLSGPCNHCGGDHTTEFCYYGKRNRRRHPDRNPDATVSWADSTIGKRWAAKGHPTMVEELGFERDGSLKKRDIDYVDRPQPAASQGQGIPNNYLNTISFHKIESDFYPMTLLSIGQVPKDEAVAKATATGTTTEAAVEAGDSAEAGVKNSISVLKVLLDTGALGNKNYVRKAALPIGFNKLICNCKNNKVCNGVDGSCCLSLGEIVLKLAYDNVYMKNDTLVIKAQVLEKSPIDLIIGRETIKENDLVAKCPGQFFTEQHSKRLRSPLRGLLTNVEADAEQVAHADQMDCSDVLEMPTSGLPYLLGPSLGVATRNEVQPSRVTTCLLLAGTIVHKDDLLDRLADDDEIDHDGMDAFAPWLEGEVIPDSGDILDLIQIEGSEPFKRNIRALCEEFRDVFGINLREKAASVAPYEVVVDLEKWRRPQNRQSPRVQSPAKEAEIQRQIQDLIEAGIIEATSAAYYSQILLVPKPDGTWRFCIDYRALNLCIQSASWPLPNIKSMFHRLGTHKSKYFGVMDLTQGYHQAPVAVNTRPFLAFIAFCGIYQYTRLPFGPKSAPSYFQEQMATVILAGLIYFICEMYLDDCLIHGKTEEEFLSRLRTILQRFREKGVIVKPSKTRLGLSKLEYVGRVISEQGLSMSEKKINSVLDFPKPEYALQMKSFIGLVNYFHDFIDEHVEYN